MKYAFLIVFSVFYSVGALAEEFLVDGNWVKAELERDDYYLLDIQLKDDYSRYHIPGAINAPYALWRTSKQSKYPGMLPNTPDLERFIGDLGITSETKVIIVNTTGAAGDMAAAARVFWTLKVMGLNNLLILDGGLESYANKFGGKIESNINMSSPKLFKAQKEFTYIADSSSILKALDSKIQLLDARTLGEFLGVLKGKPEERPGTIPGAKFLPFDWLVDLSGNIRPKSEIITLFRISGINPDRDGTIHFCHSGNRASLSWFVDYAILGNKNAKLYDASMSEWAVKEDLPMVTKMILSEQ